MVFEYDTAIVKAIKFEQESYDFYAEASKKAANARLSKFFLKIALDELRHRRILEIFRKVKDFEQALEKSEDESRTVNIMRYEEEEERFDASGLEFFLKKAIAREIQAEQMYADFLKKTEDPGLKELFKTLIIWEVTHKEKLEKEYGRS